MKLQGVAVVFALIVLPTIMILSLYLSYNIDTIALQTSYNTKLLDATYDAVSAIEINTANEKLSSVADSLRTIIDASANTFIASISSSLGLSSSSNYQIQPYIPALLYTLYDGFYIYTPTNIPKLVRDGDGLPETDNNASNNTYGRLLYQQKDGTSGATINGDTAYTQEYLLKPFMQYAATYVKGNKEIAVNYTQDNFITVNGILESGVVFSKSGYLIDTTNIDFVKNATTSSAEGTKTIDQVFEFFGAASEEEIERNIDNDRAKHGDVILSNCATIKCIISKPIEVEEGVYQNAEDIVIEDADAIKYYAKAYVFSKWMYENFGDITEKHFVNEVFKDLKYQTSPNDNEEDVTEYNYYTFADATNPIFAPNFTGPDGTTKLSIEDSGSRFSEHKKQVMQAMILYNLNSAISTYNEKSPSQKSYQLPLLEGNEWDLILNNVTMVAYLQNLPCGLKYYNNYAVVPSTNNEFMVTESTLTYIESNSEPYKLDNVTNFLGLNNAFSEYHMLDCKHLKITEPNTEESNNNTEVKTSKDYQGYREFDFLYDRMLNDSGTEYVYDHKNLACYYCMVNKNYEKYDYTNMDEFKLRIRANLTAIARERQTIYKSVAMTENYGYSFITDGGGSFNLQNLQINVPDSANIKDILITVSSTSSNPAQVPIGTAHLRSGGTDLSYLPAKQNSTSDGSVLALNLNSTTTQTLEFRDIKNCPSTVDLDIVIESAGAFNGTQPTIIRNLKETTMQVTIKLIYR